MQINNPGKSLRQQKFTSSGTFTVPIGVDQVFVTLVGGGGGGGSGRLATPLGAGGGGGGGGGDIILRAPLQVTAGDTHAVSVGLGGAGGAARTVLNNDGLPGAVGGNTQFGSSPLLRAFGRSGGSGGIDGVASGGGAGVSEIAAVHGISLSGANGGDGLLDDDGARGDSGAFLWKSWSGVSIAAQVGGGGGGGSGYASGGNVWGGVGGAGGDASITVGEDGLNGALYGSGGGGGGGGGGTESGAGGGGVNGYALIEWWQ